ncbi:hypothetical protein B0J14DRAFT_662668 [Halenospora varia]|nr:hypothetical protein B0J14DRAFT_662668 [Halenospora varia]
MFLPLAFLIQVLGLVVNASPIARSGSPSEDLTFVLPIWEGALASHGDSKDLAVLSDMKNLLGVGGSHTKLGWSFSSWALSRDIQDASNDYQFDPTNLQHMTGLSEKSGLPILVHMNNGRWADCCTPNSDGGWGDLLLDHIAAQPSTTMQNPDGGSFYSHNGGNNYFSLSRLNTVYRDYKKRNIQASAKILAQWAAQHPNLFAGVSLDSETMMPSQAADYNPLVIAEWKQWLQNTGIYSPGQQHFGTGRVPAFKDIGAFNAATGQSFASWDAMQPPRSITPGDPFSEEWQRWRVMLILNAVSDETYWIAQAGIPRTQIFGHQTPRFDDYTLVDDVITETPANGAGGVTYYGWSADAYGAINPGLRASGKNNWGVFEHNPVSTDPTFAYNGLVKLFDDGIKVICPNSWESDSATKDQYAIFGSPNFGDTFGNSLKKFLSTHGDTPRNQQPAPWNPGTRVFDFYDSFPQATATGPDNHLEPSGSVGGVARKSVYSAVGGTIGYKVSLPGVSSGQRLNLWTSLGIRDGAGIGGEVQFQVQVNGQNLFGPNFHFHKNYWTWKRWVPMMVDVTPWAGQTVTVQFLTTGNAFYGWTTWGSPAIYQSSDNNLAIGKAVEVSSTDGDSADWRASGSTDGIVDGTGGFRGWSSAPHSTPSAVEWFLVDLQSPKNFGKIVLFPRSDVTDAAGTGFPTSFFIQTSNDKSNWKTIVTASDYPRVKAGDGQIFTFEQQQARFVRVYATALGGVAGEFWYRFQLTEVAIYP